MTSLVKSSLNGLSGSCSEAVAEGARSAAGETTLEAVRRDPEVVAIARRRQFSGSEKRRLLAEAKRCKEAGTLGAHLLLDDRELAQAGWRCRSEGARPKKAGAEAGCLGTADPAAETRQCPSAPQARARRPDHRRPKKLCVALGLPTADETSGAA
jgi:hypothetical protein